MLQNAAVATAATVVKRLSPEVARALPDAHGGEEPKDLQRWRADAYEIFTTTLGASVPFYSADQWIRLKVTLETAGPVSIGFRPSILPVLSGKGRLLTTDQEWEVFLPKGTRCYYAAESVNRLSVTIEPIPWMEQLGMEIRRVAQGVLTSAQTIAAALTGQQAPPAPGPAPSLPASLQRKTRVDQLRKIEPGAKV